MMMFASILLFIHIFSFLAKTLRCAGGVIQVQNNILRDNDDLIVNLDISEDDYEVTNTRPRTKHVKDENNMFEEFDRFVNKEYEKSIADAKAKYTKSDLMFSMSINMTNRSVSMITILKTNSTNVKDYGLVKECTEVSGGARSNTSYSLVEIEQTVNKLLDSLSKLAKTSCNSTKRHKGIYIEYVKQLIIKFFKKQNYQTLAKHFWKIVAVWVAVYLVIAVPLWFTQGWCSCCLCCKFFKPQETIQEAKNYLLLNPPGMLVTKRGQIISYEPTEREKDCYEEFAHFLRTL